MKYCNLILLFLFASSYSICQKFDAKNPLLADPTVFVHKGVYYLYGTGGGNKDDGFKVFVSTDKIHWKDKGYVLKKGESYGARGFWAPQVFYHEGKFYMAYTANEHIAIAVSDSPQGPFTQNVIEPLDAFNRMIDPYIFFDYGKIYLYHVRLQNGNRIFVAELSDNLSHIKTGTLKECISAVELWEDKSNADWKVAEGPTVVKHNKFYYLIYSCNDFRNPHYAVGYATSKTPLGPWKKYDHNPIISKESIGMNGTGHGDLFTDNDGSYYVFHVHNSGTNVNPRKTAMVDIYFKKEGDGEPEAIEINTKSFKSLQKVN